MISKLRRHILITFTMLLLVFTCFSISSYAATSPSATALINTKSGAVLRSSASTTSKAITTIKNNEKVSISKEIFKSKTSTSSKNRWYYVSYGKKNGYIRADLVDNIKHTAVSGKITGQVNYRVGAGTKMTKKGFLKKGTSVLVYLKAQPVSSVKGSSSTWYKIKVGTSYRYVCSTYVDIVGSIFENNPSENNNSTNVVENGSNSSEKNQSETSNNSEASTSESSNKFEKMTDSEFDAYLTSQGFPNLYKSKLKALHKLHPNWVFIAKNTGISWDTAVSKESANGVSLIQSSQPINQRATDSNSFKPGTRTLYKTASTTTKIGSVKNMTDFTLLGEEWSGTTQWNHVKLSDGTVGYCKGSLYTQSYQGEIIGKVVASSGLNMRKAPYTSATVIKTLSNGTKVSIVLECKGSDGKTWYKIKNDSSYAYVVAEYVQVESTVSVTEEIKTVTLSKNYPVAKANKDINFWAIPNSSFISEGTIANGTEFTILSKVKDANASLWYKVYLNGKIVYIKNESLSVDGVPTESNAPTSIKGVTTTALNYRKGPGTSYALVNTFSGGTTLTIKDAVLNGNTLWYAVDLSNKTYYVCSNYVNLEYENAPSNAAPTVTTEMQKVTKVAKPSTLTGTASIKEGTWISKDGSTWFNANSQTVAYYMDPRNFLNEDRIYMFEDLSYQKEYQTTAVVTKVLTGTKLPGYGFTAKLFVDAGSSYKISPVFLAARARQETGSGSIAISGYVYEGKTVYNPFNIGATSGSNPVMNGIKYAAKKAWNTQKAAVNGSASYLASGYINAGQNSIYFQRFNVANGSTKVATHQYMTNIMAPYSEAYTTKTSYKAYGICDEALTFIIPIYSGMPSSTSLPS